VLRLWLLLPAGWLQLNDPLTRAVLFVPLFTLLLVRLHRNTLAGSPGLTGVLNLPLLTYLVRDPWGDRGQGVVQGDAGTPPPQQWPLSRSCWAQRSAATPLHVA
jgi:hypothetical protein